jgi:hypothetical protein
MDTLSKESAALLVGNEKRKRRVFSANSGERSALERAPPVDKFTTSTRRSATSKQSRGGDARPTDFFSGEMGGEYAGKRVVNPRLFCLFQQIPKYL